MDAISELHASEQLELLRLTGDAAADAAVKTIVSEHPAEPRAWFGHLAHMVSLGPQLNHNRANIPPGYEDAHDFLWDWIDDHERLLELIDPAKVKRTQRFFETYGLEISSALLHFSLADAYSCARGAQVLYLAGEFVSDPARRVRETAQLMIQMMAPDPDFSRLKRDGISFDGRELTTLHAGKKGAVVGRQIRLFHALIRSMLQDPAFPVKARWDAREKIYNKEGRPILGVPICQEDQLGTLFSFSVSVFEALPLLGVRYDDKDREAWFHVWDIIGRHLGVGVESAFSTTTPKTSNGDAKSGGGTEHVPSSNVKRPASWSFGEHITGDLACELMSVIRKRHREPSHEGKILANALLREIEGPLPRSIKPMPAAMMQYLGGREIVDILGIRTGGWGQYWLVRATDNRHVGRAVQRMRPLRMPGGEVASLITREVLQMFVEQGNFKIELPGSGRRPAAFEIDDRLTRSWGIHKAERPTAARPAPIQLT